LNLPGATFVDVFFNAWNRRADLCLIDGERRLFGYDNLGGWHCHRAGDPASHEPCAEPSVEGFLAEVAAILAAPSR
jgi:hypothetical protein